MTDSDLEHTDYTCPKCGNRDAFTADYVEVTYARVPITPDGWDTYGAEVNEEDFGDYTKLACDACGYEAPYHEFMVEPLPQPVPNLAADMRRAAESHFDRGEFVQRLNAVHANISRAAQEGRRKCRFTLIQGRDNDEFYAPLKDTLAKEGFTFEDHCNDVSGGYPQMPSEYVCW